jgi:hypothetical protein
LIIALHTSRATSYIPATQQKGGSVPSALPGRSARLCLLSKQPAPAQNTQTGGKAASHQQAYTVQQQAHAPGLAQATRESEHHQQQVFSRYTRSASHLQLAGWRIHDTQQYNPQHHTSAGFFWSNFVVRRSTESRSAHTNSDGTLRSPSHNPKTSSVLSLASYSPARSAKRCVYRYPHSTIVQG